MLSDSSRKSSNLSDSEIRRLISILTSSTPSSAFPELSEIPSELHLPIIEELELPRNKKPNPYLTNREQLLRPCAPNSYSA